MRKLGKGQLVSQNINDYKNTDDLNTVEKDGKLYRLGSDDNERGYSIFPLGRNKD